MIKIIFSILPLLCLANTVYGQQLVYHPDLTEQRTRNFTTQFSDNSMYANTIGRIQELRKNTELYTAGITAIQTEIYKSLTNVNDAIQKGRMAYHISKIIPQIFDNLITAADLAKGKPYLITITRQTTAVVTGRIAGIQEYIKKIIMSRDPKILIDQTLRDKMLYKVFTDVQIIYNYTEYLIDLFKRYNLQKTIEALKPEKYLINQDKLIINNILSKWHF